MSCLPKILLLAFMVVAAMAQNPECPPNEVFIEECSSMCEPTCDDMSPLRPCPYGCGPPMCQCKPGFVRNDDGKCIQPTDCPAKVDCPANEVFVQCSSMCEPTCKDPRFDRPCFLACGPPKCQCMPGFVRNEDGKCIQPDDCPARIECPANEVFVQCSSMCEPTCKDVGSHRPCLAACGPPKCQCIPGFVRNEDGKCVQPDGCQVDCPANEEFVQCSSMCEPTCKDPRFDRPCFLACGPPKCQCMPGFVRNEDGKCIQPDDCPARRCRFGEVFAECSLMCRPSCRDPTPICLLGCGPPKCQCKIGFVKFFGVCIPQKFCPKRG